MKVGIILTPDERSKAYLQKLIKHKINLDRILFMNDERNEKNYPKDAIMQSRNYGFDISKSVKETLKESKLQFKEFNFVDINNSELKDYLEKNPIDFLIYTGGGILRSEILKIGIRFIHLHPGIAPFYRGSTCFYYSIINEDEAGVTAYLMEEKLDAGPIIYQKLFKKPNHIFLDDVYDPHIRSETLLDLFTKKLIEKQNFRKQDPEGNIYYIIHPVLKHISILNCVQEK